MKLSLAIRPVFTRLLLMLLAFSTGAPLGFTFPQVTPPSEYIARGHGSVRFGGAGCEHSAMFHHVTLASKLAAQRQEKRSLSLHLLVHKPGRQTFIVASRIYRLTYHCSLF